MKEVFVMKKIKNLSEGDFLKLLFGVFSTAFLIGAVCMPDRGSMFSGLWQILSQPSKISTNYFALGGYAATFLNMLSALCGLENMKEVFVMKKIKNLSEGDFLKLLFGVFSAAFLIGAVCMPDRGSMFSGLWRILSQPSKISTNYFALGGYAATFLNMGLVCAICLILFLVFRGTPNNVSTLAVILTTGFGSWGINILNIWPSIFGVMLYGLVKKEKTISLWAAMLPPS